MSVGRLLLAMSVGLLAVIPIGRWPLAAEMQSLEIVTSRGVHVFAVELATTDAEVRQGLKGRTSLPDGSGMLFDFKAEVQANMTMKDTPVSLDMIFVRADGRISHIVENLTPMSDRQIYSGGPVRAVLEVAGGTARRLGIAVGDRVAHRIFGRGR